MALLAASGVAAGCALSADMSGGHADAGSLGSGSGIHSHVVEGGVADTGSRAVENGLNPLCGTSGFCNRRPPDDPLACGASDAGPASGGPGAPPARPDAGRGGHDGAPDGAATDASGPAVHDGGSLLDAAVRAATRAYDAGSGARSDGRSDASEPDASRAPSGSIMDAGAAPGASFACQVGRDDFGKPVQQCLRAGSGGKNAPWATSRDCRAGLACVGAQGAGQCLPYCCDVGTRCEDGTFCAERPLLDGTKLPPLAVPVCDKAEACALDEPFPCNGPDCKCGAGLACAIVSKDGLTGCVKPGDGKVGDPCPCAAGYFCSQATASCVKICRTSSAAAACAPGRCQAAAGFPHDFGLCVGSAPAVQ